MMNMDDFNSGVVYAAARLVEVYDNPTAAAELICLAGIGYEALGKCAEHDLAFLRIEDKNIPVGI